MAAHAAVTMPGEIGEAGRRARDLDDDAVPVEPVVRVAQVGPAQRADAPQARVVAEAGDERRLLVEVVDAVAHLFAVDGRPPRTLVVRPSPGHAGFHVGPE